MAVGKAVPESPAREVSVIHPEHHFTGSLASEPEPIPVEAETLVTVPVPDDGFDDDVDDEDEDIDDTDYGKYIDSRHGR